MSLLAMALHSSCGLTPQTGHALHQQSLGFDPHTGYQEIYHHSALQSPVALKAKATSDPDLPSLKESLTGPHAEQFWESHGC